MRRPFLLPCLAVGSVSFVAFVSSLLVMSETLPRLVEEDRGSQEVSGSSDEMPSKASMPTGNYLIRECSPHHSRPPAKLVTVSYCTTKMLFKGMGFSGFKG